MRAASDPGDYLAFAETFHTLLMKDVPVMKPNNRNEAKRFVTLIDALYDAKVKFICSAAVPRPNFIRKEMGRLSFNVLFRAQSRCSRLTTWPCPWLDRF